PLRGAHAPAHGPVARPETIELSGQSAIYPRRGLARYRAADGRAPAGAGQTLPGSLWSGDGQGHGDVVVPDGLATGVRETQIRVGGLPPRAESARRVIRPTRLADHPV